MKKWCKDENFKFLFRGWKMPRQPFGVRKILEDIIVIDLYRSCIKFFFITKMITPWWSIMIITNDHLINNYVLEWWKFKQFFWVIFGHFWSMAIIKVRNIRHVLQSFLLSLNDKFFNYEWFQTTTMPL